MSRTIKAVMVGCGHMSAAWLGPLSGMDDVEIVGLVDIKRANAKGRAKDFKLDGAVIGTDLQKVLDTVDPDVVFDCTLPETHADITTTALRHGCHVLGEKPLADSMVNARRSLRAAGKADRIYAVIQNRRYQEPMRRMRRLLKSRTLGDITTINCDFFLGAHFGGFRDRMEHVLLLDMAIHTLDQARMLSGADPVSVYCREWNPKGSWYDHDASAVAIFEMTGDIIFAYRGSWCSEGLATSWEAQWRILCTRGSVTWDGFDGIAAQKVVGRTGVQRKVMDVALPPLGKRDRIGGHAALIREFIDRVKRGGTPETVCTDNIKSLAMVFAAVESARKNRPVKVKWR